MHEGAKFVDVQNYDTLFRCPCCRLLPFSLVCSSRSWRSLWIIHSTSPCWNNRPLSAVSTSVPG